ncbi:MAG: hypothetical protein FWF10_00980 [Clostridiales bacterium]|nr:hypothetical protein [Clostridiales bacterium]
MEYYSIYIIIYAICIGYSFLLSLAIGVCKAVGFQSIAKRRGIEQHAVAWDILFGIGPAYVLGAISDDYSRRMGERETNHRKWLLGLSVAANVVATAMLLLSLILMSRVLSSLRFNIPFAVSSLIIIFVGTYLVLLPLVVAQSVFFYIALYKLYKSCDSKNALLYLLLSIFVSVCMPVFLLILRNKDDKRLTAPDECTLNA